MSRTNRALVALAAAMIVLVVAVWFDTTVARYAEEQAATVGGISGWAAMETLGSLLVAGSVLLLGALAWRSASLVVGLAYVVVGGAVVALPWVFWNFALMTSPPVLPEALALAIRNLFYLTVGGSNNEYFLNGGPLNAVETIGAAMLISGIATLVLWWRRRADAEGRAEVGVPTADPMHP